VVVEREGHDRVHDRESARNTAPIRAVVGMLRTFLEQNALLLSGRRTAPSS
jgi:hypothetical protein